MDISLAGSGYLLPVGIIGIVIVLVIVVVIYRKGNKKQPVLKGSKDTSRYPHQNRLDYQQKVKTHGVIPPADTSTAVAHTAGVPKPKDIDLTSNRRDMTESLVALEEKYSLLNFTIATADGLVFGSSGGNTAQTDAATYSEIFKKDPHAKIPDAVLFGLTHKGSYLIGIVRAKTPLPVEIMEQIGDDTKVILNWWI